MLHSLLRKLRTLTFPPTRYVGLRNTVSRGPLHMLLPEEHIPTPETAQMQFGAFSENLASPVYTAPAVYSVPLYGALYCATTHCVLDQSGAVIKESTGPGGRSLYFAPGTFSRPVRRISGVATAFRCCFHDFYHLLVDNLSRVDLLNFEYFRSFPSISLLCPELTPLEAFFLDKLLPDNVSVVPVDPRFLYEPDQFLFNTFITSRASGYLRGPYVQRLRNRLDLPASSPRTERILVSRRRAAKGRRIRNEDELLAALRPLGFKRYVLEDLPITEQIALFHRADAVIAPHGAGLSHLLFARHVSVLELFASAEVIPHYYLLSKALGHEYSFLTGPEPTQDGNFSVDISAVQTRAVDLISASPSKLGGVDSPSGLPAP